MVYECVLLPILLTLRERFLALEGDQSTVPSQPVDKIQPYGLFSGNNAVIFKDWSFINSNTIINKVCHF